MNGDGHPDIVMDNEFFNTTSVLLNNGDGTFGTKFDTPGRLVPRRGGGGRLQRRRQARPRRDDGEQPAWRDSSRATATAPSSP